MMLSSNLITTQRDSEDSASASGDSTMMKMTFKQLLVCCFILSLWHGLRPLSSVAIVAWLLASPSYIVALLLQ